MLRHLRFVFLVAVWMLVRPAAAVVSANWAIVETNGWVLDIDFLNCNTNAAFTAATFGWATNNTITSPMGVILTLTSPGFDSTGTSNNVPRTLYGTKQLYTPYPSPFTNDVSDDGSGGVIVRIGLTSMVLSNDVTGTFEVQPNLYSNNVHGIGSVLANYSTNISPKPFGNWSWPDRRVITNTTLDLHWIGAHWSAQLGQPLAAVAFVTKDQHGHSVSNVVAKMTAPNVAFGDAIPFAEYSINQNISSLTSGDVIRSDVYMFPWVGTNVGTTADGVNTLPPNYAPQTNICDYSTNYGTSYAIVDPTNGVTAGVVVKGGTWNGSTSTTPFDTISHALVACKASNLVWYTRSDIGGSFIALTNGTFPYAGSSGSYGTNPPAQTVIFRHPNCALANVSIGSQSGDSQTANWLEIQGITEASTSALNYWNNNGYVWFDKCNIANSGSSVMYNQTPWAVTRCTISYLGSGNQNLRGYSSRSSPCYIIRGNTFATNQTAMIAYVCAGNFFGGCFADAIEDAQGLNVAYEPIPQPMIIYNNLGTNFSTTATGIGGFATNTVGALIANNVWETTNYLSSPPVSLWADSCNSPMLQCLVFNNTWRGQRFSMNYDEYYTNVVTRAWWVVKGNYSDDYNLKAAEFNGGGTNTPDPHRIGNYASRYGVDYAGNCLWVFGIGGGFNNATYGGFDGIANHINMPDNLWQQFVHTGSAGSSTNGPGLGNYMIQSPSPLIINPGLLGGAWVLPFDIQGVPRGQRDPPGAYSSANPPRGWFF